MKEITNIIYKNCPTWFKGLSPQEQYGIYRELWLKNLIEYATFIPKIKIIAEIAQDYSPIVAGILLHQAYPKIDKELQDETITDLIHKELHYTVFHPPSVDQHIDDMRGVFAALEELKSDDY